MRKWLNCQRRCSRIALVEGRRRWPIDVSFLFLTLKSRSLETSVDNGTILLMIRWLDCRGMKSLHWKRIHSIKKPIVTWVVSILRMLTTRMSNEVFWETILSKSDSASPAWSRSGQVLLSPNSTLRNLSSNRLAWSSSIGPIRFFRSAIRRQATNLMFFQRTQLAINWSAMIVS